MHIGRDNLIYRSEATVKHVLSCTRENRRWRPRVTVYIRWQSTYPFGSGALDVRPAIYIYIVHLQRRGRDSLLRTDGQTDIAHGDGDLCSSASRRVTLFVDRENTHSESLINHTIAPRIAYVYNVPWRNYNRPDNAIAARSSAGVIRTNFFFFAKYVHVM